MNQTRLTFGESCFEKYQLLSHCASLSARKTPYYPSQVVSFGFLYFCWVCAKWNNLLVEYTCRQSGNFRIERRQEEFTKRCYTVREILRVSNCQIILNQFLEVWHYHDSSDNFTFLDLGAFAFKTNRTSAIDFVARVIKHRSSLSRGF